ncbi:RNA polymerase sigma factor [Candidatus Parcubacteria bacterium]|nr:RNA polymerase sigma factor [Candidatus Parcubacteria bacterium]
MTIDEKKRQFEALYEREADALFRFCLLRTSNREQARDLVQETFVRLWKSLLEGKSIVEERAFLFTVARHLIIDWYRKAKTQSLEALFEGDEEGGFDVPDAAAYERIGFSAEVGEVVAAMKRLGPKYSEIVYLRLVEEMEPREIGEALGLSANVVSVRLNRGIAALKKLLQVEE